MALLDGLRAWWTMRRERRLRLQRMRRLDRLERLLVKQEELLMEVARPVPGSLLLPIKSLVLGPERLEQVELPASLQIPPSLLPLLSREVSRHELETELQLAAFQARVRAYQQQVAVYAARAQAFLQRL